MRVLFLSEAVTLAHSVRSLRLMQKLSQDQVLFASTHFPNVVQQELGGIPFELLAGGVSPEHFQKSIYVGFPAYTEPVLESYIQEDLRVMDSFQPDVVVSDFRLSASISCRLRSVPLVTLTNVVWSPYVEQNMVAPECLAAKIFGVSISNFVMKNFGSAILNKMAVPMNRVRTKYNLPAYDDIYSMYTDGDWVAYMDVEGLVRHKPLPTNHLFLGPVLYSSSVVRPKWFDDFLKFDKRIVVTLGSSGDVHNLKVILNAAKEAACAVAIATAGRLNVQSEQPNVFVSDYLDLQDLLPFADLFVGNGGSLTNYLALSYGVPVLALPYNLDQYFTSQAISATGAGVFLRSGLLNKNIFLTDVEKALSNKQMKINAQRMQMQMRASDVHTNFQELLRRAAEGGCKPSIVRS